MTSHFQPKSLLFYGVMIGSVAILFRFVSGYGETHLQAPPNINGRYLINEPVAGCPDDRLMLVLQQSGVYLNGSLQLVNAQEAIRVSQGQDLAEESPSLTGHWQDQTITLSGKLSDPMSGSRAMQSSFPAGVVAQCQLEQNLATTSVNLEGKLTGSPISELVGTLSLGSTQVDFIAKREVVETTSAEH